MTNKWKQLSLEEREQLFLWKQNDVSFREIGRRLGRSHTSISKEWKRNKTGVGHRSREYAIFRYLPCKAQEKAVRRAFRQRAKAPLKGSLIFLYVRKHLKAPYFWSPETIAGRLSIDHPGSSITTETIYSYIYGKRQKRMKLWRYLKLHRKKRMKKHGRKVKNQLRITGALPIEHRSSRSAKRQELGHWETDNMEGKRSDRSGVSVSVDRMSRQIRLRKLTDHTAATKTRALKTHIPQDRVKTVTIDRGVENTLLPKRLSLPVYACNAYHSWEKGSVENAIGRLRWFLPKGISVDGITQAYLTTVEQIMNTTPRKVLGYLTPDEYAEKIQQRSSKP